MKKLAFIFAAVVAAVCLSGCTSCMLIDLYNRDVFTYRYAPWDNKDAEEAAARARYYWNGAAENYPTNVEHVLEIRLHKCGETNDIKRAVYYIPGTKEN